MCFTTKGFVKFVVCIPHMISQWRMQNTEQTLCMNVLLTRCGYDSQVFKNMDRGFTENCGLDDGHGVVVGWIDCVEYCVDWYDTVDVV